MENQKTSNVQLIVAFCLVILTIIASSATLMYLKSVMVPFVLSVFLYFMIAPLVNWLQVKLRVPRPVAVLVTLGVGLFITLIFVAIFSNSIRALVDNMQVYQTRSTETFAAAEQLMKRLGINAELEALRSQVETADLFRFVQQFASEFLAVVGNLGLITIYLLFFLIGSPMTRKSSIVNKINSRISKYVWMKMVSSLATGILVGITLGILGVDLAFMFGVVAFLTNFIPNVGFIVATVLPLPLAFLKFGFSWEFWCSLIIPASIQFVIGNIFEARMMGKGLDLHPVTILFFLLLWGVMWGIPGMFLAVPITAIIKLVLEHFPKTRFAAEILAGRLPV